MDGFSIRRGALVFAGERKLEILEFLTSNKIKARDLVTHEVVTISPGDIDFEFELKHSESVSEPSKKPATKPTIDSFSEDEMRLADLRYTTLLPFLSQKPLPKIDVENAAKTLNVSVSQVYRLIALMDSDKGFVSLIQKRRGRTTGAKQISGVVEDVIQAAIDEHYKGTGVTVESIHEKIKEQCMARNLPIPSLGTVSNRIKERSPRELLTNTLVCCL